ncbi:general amidase [Cutaneotrichosporon oleaginosum]|uniref:amidase n=1 Tax=Cutaneotrichosporon oleaginosum TaxID=879819 RepID=A0A0J1B0F8_9TREE|nr:general amidase [Cutaneotrichosporon oleaginosum]KLT41084.1 general amidase [Cutaneotrichosporon oleaginosum]
MTDWEAKAAAKRAQRDALLPKDTLLPSAPTDLDVSSVPATSGILSARELEITGTPSITALLDALKARTYSAEEVVSAFCRRAAIAHQLTNCLTEIFFDRALAHARDLDAEYARTGRPRGPLHGLPVSLKEQIAVRGVERSFGFVGWLGRVPESDAAITTLLVEAGAVPYCITNVAQHLGFGAAVNNVFGETCNPHNRNLTPGGSSGGEGALIALRGSVLGVGSDIGGSVRIPAGFSGLYSLRPSYQRFPYEGTCNSQEGQESLRSVLGPMAATVDGLRLAFKAVIDGRPWRLDPVVLRMPWSEERYRLAEHGGGERLVFGMMSDDGFVRAAPPYARALADVKAALETAGHTVVPWKAYDAERGYALFGEVWMADGHKDLYDTLALSGEPRVGPLGSGPETLLEDEVTITKYWEIQYRKQRFLKEQLDHWNRTAEHTGTGRPVDAIICPVSATPPQTLRGRQYYGYTAWCNLADLPSAVIPVTRVNPAKDLKVTRDDYYNWLDKELWEMYDPEVYKNGPIGVQIIGQKDEDEAVIRMAEIVDAALKASKSC